LNVGRFGHTDAAMTTAARKPERREERFEDDHERLNPQAMAPLEELRLVRK
jgi:hypothetical protein